MLPLHTHHSRQAWLAMGLCLLAFQAFAADPVDTSSQELLRQQERERALRQQQETRPDVRLNEPAPQAAPLVYPDTESLCFRITRIELQGEEAARFQFALEVVRQGEHAAVGRCLGTQGINTAMAHVQNAMVTAGFVTSRVLVGPQDLASGVLVLTVLPGRVRQIRFAEDASPHPHLANILPLAPGDILNLRAIEQALENLKRVPTAEADIQIAPAEGNAATGTATSTKTMDTVGSVTYQNPIKITSTLNKYVDDMVGFVQDGNSKLKFELNNLDILNKQMQLAVPANSSAEQMAAIAKSIEYAQSKGVQIIVTKVR